MRTHMNAADSRQFRRTQISMGDFLMAIRFLKTAPVHATSTTEYEALLMSAVICYARPFSGNEKAAGARATSRLALPTPKDDDGKLHRRIIRALIDTSIGKPVTVGRQKINGKYFCDVCAKHYAVP